MRRTLGAAAGIFALLSIGVPAGAADLRPVPVKAPATAPVVAPVPFSWTGCYVGVHGGGGIGRKDWRLEDEGSAIDTRHNVHGWLVGGQLGCNLQRDRWVFGIEGQAAYADLRGTSTETFLVDDVVAVINPHSKVDVVGSVAGRIGYAFGAAGRTLLFVKGGLGFAQDRHWYDATVDGVPAGGVTSSKYMRWGWMVGAGIEQALGDNWSFKAEYNYTDLGRRDVRFCNVEFTDVCGSFPIRQDLHIFKVGVNYRFGGPRPVIARY